MDSLLTGSAAFPSDQAATTPEMTTSGVVSFLASGGSGALAMVAFVYRTCCRLRRKLGTRQLAAGGLTGSSAARPGQG